MTTPTRRALAGAAFAAALAAPAPAARGKKGKKKNKPPLPPLAAAIVVLQSVYIPPQVDDHVFIVTMDIAAFDLRPGSNQVHEYNGYQSYVRAGAIDEMREYLLGVIVPHISDQFGDDLEEERVAVLFG